MEQGKQFYLSQDSRSDWYFHNSWNFNDSEKCCIFGQNLPKNNNKKKTRWSIFLEFTVKKKMTTFSLSNSIFSKLMPSKCIVKKNKNHRKLRFEADVRNFGYSQFGVFFLLFWNYWKKQRISRSRNAGTCQKFLESKKARIWWSKPSSREKIFFLLQTLQNPAIFCQNDSQEFLKISSFWQLFFHKFFIVRFFSHKISNNKLG